MRQRQLALERQRAAAARQLIGVGVVAQSNPLASANSNHLKQAHNWQFPEAKEIPLSKDRLALPGTNPAPVVAAANASNGFKRLGSNASATAGRTSAISEMSETMRSKLNSRGSPGTAQGPGPQPRGASRQNPGKPNQLDEMLGDLDVEELVDQLTGKEARTSVSTTQAEDNVDVVTPGRRQQPTVAPDSPKPQSGAWGVDDRLTVQGPPPKVVAVEGFDEPGPEFSPARRQPAGGRRRPPQATQGAAQEADTVIKDFGASGDSWRRQDQPPAAAAKAEAPDAKNGKGSRRWWNRFGGSGAAEQAPGRSPSPGGSPDTAPNRSKPRGPDVMTEVTQISDFCSED